MGKCVFLCFMYFSVVFSNHKYQFCSPVVFHVLLYFSLVYQQFCIKNSTFGVFDFHCAAAFFTRCMYLMCCCVFFLFIHPTCQFSFITECLFCCCFCLFYLGSVFYLFLCFFLFILLPCKTQNTCFG